MQFQKRNARRSLCVPNPCPDILLAAVAASDECAIRVLASTLAIVGRLNAGRALTLSLAIITAGTRGQYSYPMFSSQRVVPGIDKPPEERPEVRVRLHLRGIRGLA